NRLPGSAPTMSSSSTPIPVTALQKISPSSDLWIFQKRLDLGGNDEISVGCKISIFHDPPSLSTPENLKPAATGHIQEIAGWNARCVKFKVQRDKIPKPQIAQNDPTPDGDSPAPNPTMIDDPAGPLILLVPLTHCTLSRFAAIVHTILLPILATPAPEPIFGPRPKSNRSRPYWKIVRDEDGQIVFDGLHPKLERTGDM
ncbi:hypothetical protein BJ138DRAFT_1109781, partial [Hygrophoropsis aurantiaca]